ncbi:hypothetical protein ACA910_014186 [Epithemia clementina (nom. ined.)]
MMKADDDEPVGDGSSNRGLSIFWKTKSHNRRQDNHQEERHSFFGSPNRNKTTVPQLQVAARRVRLAWKTSRTNAVAKRTLLEYAAAASPMPNDDYHTEPVGSGLASTTTNNLRQSRGVQDDADGNTFCSDGASSITRNTKTSTISSPYRTGTRQELSLSLHSTNAATCSTIDDALFSLYQCCPDDDEKNDPSLSEGCETSTAINTSFHLPQEYDSLLDAEHPYSRQDVKVAQYWQAQLLGGSTVPQQQQSNNQAQIPKLQQEQQHSPLEDAIWQLLENPNQRPLWQSIQELEQQEQQHKLQPEQDDRTRNDVNQKLSSLCSSQRPEEGKYYDDDSGDDEEKKNDTPSRQQHQNTNNDSSLLGENQNKEEEEEDDWEFGDFQSANAFTIHTNQGPITATATHGDSPPRPLCMSPREMIVTTDTTKKQHRRGHFPQEEDDGDNTSEEDMFHTPEQQPLPETEPFARAATTSPHPDQPPKQPDDPHNKDPTSDGTASLIAQADNILQLVKGTANGYKILPAAATHCHGTTRHSSDKDQGGEENEDLVNLLSTPQLVQMAQRYLGDEPSATTFHDDENKDADHRHPSLLKQVPCRNSPNARPTGGGSPGAATSSVLASAAAAAAAQSELVVDDRHEVPKEQKQQEQHRPFDEPFSPVSPQSTTVTTTVIATAPRSIPKPPPPHPQSPPPLIQHPTKDTASSTCSPPQSHVQTPAKEFMFQSSSPLSSSPSSAFDSPLMISSDQQRRRRQGQNDAGQQWPDVAEEEASSSCVMMPPHESSNGDDQTLSFRPMEQQSNHYLPQLPLSLAASLSTTSKQETIAKPPLKPSIVLPLDDLTTLEGRWTRRRQMEYKLETAAAEEEGEKTREGHRRQGVDLVEDLPFLAPRDETVQVLNSLPWEYLGFFDADNDNHNTNANDIFKTPQHNSELELWDDVMTDRLCKYDTRLEQVQAEMARRLDPVQMEQANQLIHVWDTNLRVAQVYYERAVKSLCSAVNRSDLGGFDSSSSNKEDSNKAQASLQGGGEVDEGSGLLGQSLLLDLWQSHEDYKRLDGLLGELQSMFDIEQEIIRRIDNFDAQQSSALEEYRNVCALADQVVHIASSGESLASVSCLSETRDRLATLGDRFWNRLQQQLTSLVTRVCRRRLRPLFSSIVTRRVTKSFSNKNNNRKMKQILLRNCSNMSNDSNSDDTCNNNAMERSEYERIVKMQMDRNTDWTEYQRIIRAGLDLRNVAVSSDAASASAWSQTIVQSLSFEAMRCFAVALLDPPDRRASRYDPDLVQLSDELHDWGDTSKLRQTCHNLVTIRFHFEASEFYFPGVYQRLCDGLINILRMATDFVEFHQHASSNASEGEGDGARLEALTNALTESLEPLWAQCEEVLVQCLDEYLNFAGKRDLFHQEEATIDDSAWLQDLVGWQKVLLVTENFLSHRSWLLHSAKTTNLISMLESGGSESELYVRLLTICRAHLRLVHVETVNSIGKMLSQDSWDFVTLTNADGSDVRGCSNGIYDLRKAIESRLNKFEERISEMGVDSSTKSTGMHNANVYDWSGNLPTGTIASLSVAREFMESFKTTNNQDEPSRIMPISIAEGLLCWISRIILVADKLPLVAGDIGEVVTNTFDLYVTTVLRVCCGNAKNERVLLGCDRQNPLRTVTSEDDRRSPLPTGKRPASPAIFFGKERRRSSKTSKPQIFRPALREADICAPLLRDEAELCRLRKFVVRAQDSLQGIVNLDRVDAWLPDPEGAWDSRLSARILERKVAAAWSCFVLAAVGDLCYLIISSRLAKDHGAAVRSNLESLHSYVQSLAAVLPKLVESAVLISSVKAMNGHGVVSSIVSVGAGWEECKLHEQANEYVEDLCEKCTRVGGNIVELGMLPLKIMTHCLETIISVGYLCMLEGFSRVAFCSTEGRALMALDLASFSAGVLGEAFTKRLETMHINTTIREVSNLDEMKRVDTYIKVFYYPQDEVVKWVKEHFRDYNMNHAMALVANFFYSSGSEETLPNLLQEIKKLYDSEESKFE